MKFRPLWMLLGLCAGMSVLVFTAVQLRLASIDPNDPVTWPHMGPQVAYLAIPVFTSIAALPCFLMNWLLDLAKMRRVSRPGHWFGLGVAYIPKII